MQPHMSGDVLKANKKAARLRAALMIPFCLDVLSERRIAAQSLIRPYTVTLSYFAVALALG
jgi:hypothetical protein